VVSKQMSTASNGPNPAPDTVTELVGGPLVTDSTMLGKTAKARLLVAFPPGVVAVIGPDDGAAAGTAAVILISDWTLNAAATPPNFTAVAPVKPEPVIVTLVPIVPEDGLNELTTGAAATAGDADAATRPAQVTTASAAARRTRRPTGSPGEGHAKPGRRDLDRALGRSSGEASD
jgi:hypothetical protein